MSTFTKAATDVIQYDISWAYALSPSDFIASSTWNIPPALTNVASTFTRNTTKILIGGGTVGAQYTLTNTVHTAGGETLSRTITLSIVANIPAI